MKQLLLTYLLMLPLCLYAQILQTAYIEVPVDRKQGSNYEVKPLGEEGILCLLSSDEYVRNGQRRIVMSLYDTALAKRWQKDLLIAQEEEVVHTSHEPGLFYMLTKKREDEYRVMKIVLDTGALYAKELTRINNFTVSNFKTSRGHLLLGGEVDRNPAVMLYAFDGNEAAVVLPSVTQLRAELQAIVVDSAQQSFYLLLEKKRPVNEPAIYVNRYDWEGRLLQNHDVRISRDYNLLTYRPLIRKDGNLMIYGSYALGGEIYAQGVYNIAIENGQITSNRFYDFGYLKNFFNYMPEKARNRRIKKVKEMLENEKRMKMHYKLFVHDLIQQEDRVILMAETYDAEVDYRRRNDNMYGLPFYDFSMRRYMWGMGGYSYLPSSFARDRWFDRSGGFPTQFKYKHAILLAFNGEGKLLWDNAFVYKDTESEFPIEVSQAYVNNDTAVVVQMTQDEELLFKASRQSEYVEENTAYKLPAAEEGDITDSFQDGGILRWYGPHFLSSGIKKLRNKRADMNTREVFFLLRVSYDPSYKPKNEE